MLRGQEIAQLLSLYDLDGSTTGEVETFFQVHVFLLVSWWGLFANSVFARFSNRGTEPILVFRAGSC